MHEVGGDRCDVGQAGSRRDARVRRIDARRSTKFLLWSLSIAGSLVACSDPRVPPVDLVIRDARVIDVDAGEWVGGRSVVVDGGRIVSILGEGDEIPAAERLIDATDRFLIPGLWDAHVHFRGGSELESENADLLPLYVANGVTTVRDAGGDLTPAVLEWRRAIAAGERVGPRIFTSGPKLEGPTGGWEGSIRLTEAAQVPAALDSLDAMGTDYVKIYDGTTSREVYLAIVAEAQRRDRIVSGHMPFSVGFLEAVESGLDISDHLYYAFKGGSPIEDEITERFIGDGSASFRTALAEMVDARDLEFESATWATLAAAGTAVTPTLHIGRVLARVAEVDHGSDLELRYVGAGIEATYGGRVESALASSAEARADRKELEGVFRSMIRPMLDAGVSLLAGSDAGPFNSYVYPGFSLHDELAALVEAGMTPAEALRSATIEPAKALRVDDTLGRIAPGHVADLVLLSADPLDDIDNTRAIDRVILRGEEVFDRPALEALLEAASQRRESAAGPATSTPAP